MLFQSSSKVCYFLLAHHFEQNNGMSCSGLLYPALLYYDIMMYIQLDWIKHITTMFPSVLRTCQTMPFHLVIPIAPLLLRSALLERLSKPVLFTFVFPRGMHHLHTPFPALWSVHLERHLIPSCIATIEELIKCLLIVIIRILVPIHTNTIRSSFSLHHTPNHL